MSEPVAPREIGRYAVGEAIGYGGMAKVYLARQVDLDREVALKELRLLDSPDDPSLAERFLREARVGGSLSHANIVTVFEYFKHEETPYIAMEYVRRGSLRPWIGNLSLAQVAGVLEGLLAALDHAEAFSVVHRDLKPENLLVTEQGQIKVADFGIAKARMLNTGGFQTATGTTVGTPNYMAPEQAMAGELGPYTDLYSVGVMAYEMLVGLPFADSEAPMAVMLRHINEEIPPAHTVDPSIDADLSAWIGRLLVKEPAEREQHAAAAWEGLEEIVLRLLGSRWRREARLMPTEELPATRPLTPAPFTATGADTPVPSDGFITFGTPAGQDAVGEDEPGPAAPPDPPPAAAAPDPPPTTAPDPAPPTTVPDPAPAGAPDPTRATSAPRPAAPVVTPAAPTTALPAASPGGGRGRAVAAGVAAVVVIGVVAALVVGGGGDKPAKTTGATTAPSAAPRVTGTVDIGGATDGVAFGNGAVYAVSDTAKQLVQLDPATAKVVARAPVGADPDSIAADGGAVFVTEQAGQNKLEIFRTAPKLALVSSSVIGSQPETVALDGDGVWVALRQADGVRRFDAATGDETGPLIHTGGQPIDVDVADGRVWVCNSTSDTVSIVDAASGKVTRTVKVGHNPRNLVLAFGAAWVVLTDDNAVQKLNAQTGEPEGAPIEVGDKPHKIAATDRGLWVTNSQGDNVSEVDPRTGREIARVEVDAQPLGIAAGGGAVWVGSVGNGTVTRIDPGQ